MSLLDIIRSKRVDEVGTSVVDSGGNVWVRGDGNSVTEFVGGASCAGAPKALVPIAASNRSAQ